MFLRLLRKKEYWWNNKNPNNYFKKKDDLIMYKLINKFDQFVIKDIIMPITKASFGIRRNRFNF